MDDDKLKLILAVLGGIVFSLVFVLLAFVLPLQGDSGTGSLPSNESVEKISQESHVTPPPSAASHLDQ